GEGFYFIADYHAMTSGRDAAALKENIRELAIDFLACGLDPEKSMFFRNPLFPFPDRLFSVFSALDEKANS
ncbi:MAG: tryptophan--tRNA ligase, partial [Akkermansiaceae bacterium]